MHIPAITDDIKSVMMVGSLARMRQAVMTGTSRSHGDRLNVCASVPAKSSLCSLPLWLMTSPATVNMPRVIIIDGTVVMSI